MRTWSSVSGRIWTASETFSASRRATAANASHSCGATGACSGGSIAPLSSLVRPALCSQTLNIVKDRPRDQVLPRAWDGAPRAVDRDDRDLVLAGIEPDSWFGDVVNHHRVQTLSLELLLTGGDPAVAVLGRESHKDLVGALSGSERREHVLGRLELDRGRDASLLLQLLVGRSCRPEVGHGRGHQQD